MPTRNTGKSRKGKRLLPSRLFIALMALVIAVGGTPLPAFGEQPPVPYAAAASATSESSNASNTTFADAASESSSASNAAFANASSESAAFASAGSESTADSQLLETAGELNDSNGGGPGRVMLVQESENVTIADQWAGDGQAKITWMGKSVQYHNAVGTAVKWDLFTENTTAYTVAQATTYNLNPTSPSYSWSLAGWSTASDDLTVEYTPGSSTAITDSCDLWPIYCRTFTSGVNAATTALQYYNPRKAVGSQFSAVPTASTASLSDYGWTFTGWLASTSGTSNPTTSANMNMNAISGATNSQAGTFYAIYERSTTAAMTFAHNVPTGADDYPQGATASVSPTAATQGYNSGAGSQVTTNRTLTVSSLPACGFTRVKWAATRNGSNKVIWNITTYPTTSGTTTTGYQDSSFSWDPGLCAPVGASAVVSGWTRTKYEIFFAANGGTGSMSSVLVDVGSSYVTPACSFTKTDHYCRGWNTAADASGASYAIGASFTPSGNDDITLYAQWLPNVPMPTAGVSDFYLMAGGIAALAVAFVFVVLLIVILRGRRMNEE